MARVQTIAGYGLLILRGATLNMYVGHFIAHRGCLERDRLLRQLTFLDGMRFMDLHVRCPVTSEAVAKFKGIDFNRYIAEAVVRPPQSCEALQTLMDKYGTAAN